MNGSSVRYVTFVPKERSEDSANALRLRGAERELARRRGARGRRRRGRAAAAARRPQALPRQPLRVPLLAKVTNISHTH